MPINAKTDLERHASGAFLTSHPVGRETMIKITVTLRSWLGIVSGERLRAVPMSDMFGSRFWHAERADGKIISVPEWAAEVTR